MRVPLGISRRWSHLVRACSRSRSYSTSPCLLITATAGGVSKRDDHLVPVGFRFLGKGPLSGEGAMFSSGKRCPQSDIYVYIYRERERHGEAGGGGKGRIEGGGRKPRCPCPVPERFSFRPSRPPRLSARLSTPFQTSALVRRKLEKKRMWLGAETRCHVTSELSTTMMDGSAADGE